MRKDNTMQKPTQLTSGFRSVRDVLGPIDHRARLQNKIADFYSEMEKRFTVVNAKPEAGMATAEYAVVLVSATGFAGLLVAILKSDAVREILTTLVRNALSIG